MEEAAWHGVLAGDRRDTVADFHEMRAGGQ